MAKRLQFTKTKVLLVEGIDDIRFFTGLVEVLKVGQDIQIEDYEGKNSLSKYLASIVDSADFKQNVASLGIVRDADSQGEASSFQAICNALGKVNFSAHDYKITPIRPNLRINTCILCDSTGYGRLEEMILEAVANDWRMQCIQEYWECLNQNNAEKYFLPKDENKSKLAVFLASQEISSVRPEFWAAHTNDEYHLHTAVKRRYLHLDHPVYDKLKDFLLKL